MTKATALIAARLALGVLTLTAAGVQFALHVRAGFPVANFFSYFTILSNLIAGAVLLLGGLLLASRREAPSWYERARGAAALYMAVVGLVFAVLLRGADLGPLLPWVNAVHHYVMPVAVVAEWVFSPPRARLGTKFLLVCLSFPLLYLVYSLVRGATVGWYPYPFLNPAVAGGYGVVGLYVVGIVVAFFVVGWILFRANGGAEAHPTVETPRRGVSTSPDP